MSTRRLTIIIGITIVIFIGLFAGYRVGADLAETRNRADAAAAQENR